MSATDSVEVAEGAVKPTVMLSLSPSPVMASFVGCKRIPSSTIKA